MNEFDKYKEISKNISTVPSDSSVLKNLSLAAALERDNSSLFAAAREMQRTYDLINDSKLSATASLGDKFARMFGTAELAHSNYEALNTAATNAFSTYKELTRIAEPIRTTFDTIENVYAPFFEKAKSLNEPNFKNLFMGISKSTAVTKAVSDWEFLNTACILNDLSKYDYTEELKADDFSLEEAEELYSNGEISDDEIYEEVTKFAQQKQSKPEAIWDKKKKSKWILALKIFLILTRFVFNPVLDYIEDKARDALGITQFLEDSGVYDAIDSIFGSRNNNTISEEEAKSTVDKDKTGNISKQKREDLLKKIEEIRKYISNAPQDENTGNLLSYLSEIEKDVNGKKYGLVFEEHREEIDEVLDTHTPVLTDNTDLFIDNGGQMNYLIEGDNLASLKLLEKTHKGRIDLIYIDPPYNTLSEGFVYSDIQIDKNDTFQHSKWSSLIYKRLNIAKKLMSKKGVVFISIDDNEIYSLKFLCDDVFGVENYISTITVIVKPEGRRYGAFAKTHEYILVYANKIENIDLNEIEVEGVNYKYFDELGGFNLKGLRNRNVRAFNSTNRPNLRYPFYVDINNPNKDGLCVVSTTPKENYIEVWASTVDGLESVWRWGKETASKKIHELIAYKGKDNEIRIFQKERKLTQTAKTTWNKKEFISQKGTKEVQEILGKGKFDFPKPLELISQIVKIGSNKRTIVLDFFAGSGTTGHAVMKLNAEDSGNRQFILCTNNENNICRDVTYERIKRVIDKENYSASLKYYMVDYVPISERMYYEYADELLKHIRELVELENGINFIGNAEIAIVLTDEELNDFTNNVDQYSACKKLYMGHDLLPDEEQERIIRENDIEISIIPDYYYKDLQER